MSIDSKMLVPLCENLKLLYVEDDEYARSTTLQLLKNFFKDISIAVDGSDGLDKFLTQKFDLIISDINMPNLNGMDMLKVIRETNKSIPVLLLTA